MDPTARDREILDACLKGEAGGWDRFVRQYTRLVYSVAIRYRLPAEDADDVHQAVFLAAVSHLKELREVSRVAAWLITTTHRECWRIGRKRQRNLSVTEDFADLDEPSQSTAETAERLQAMREEMSFLSEKCRELIHALYSDGAGPSYRNIAARLGITVGSIGPSRMRCLSQLTEALRARGFEAPSDEKHEK
ncbi:MAG: sigma-70 family RNA polymerase sigma factor [Planctomycetota bacterium]|nr:sigma-70 family RNA polymerase sigma factor [Planctomycetota bacterium]